MDMIRVFAAMLFALGLSDLPDKTWAFRPVERPAVPEVKGRDWCRNPIDRFILERLENEALSPSPPAAPATLCRRVFFDVTGLPPAIEELEELLSDSGDGAYERLVDKLLSSPRYGERWARHWLDVVRFAETHGFETNTPRDNAWPYRDYVIQAFNEDKPYHRFIFEQLAGDAAGAEAATGFLVGGPYDTVKSPDLQLTRQQRMDELHDIVSTTGSAFLGLTVGCARCHDHKFDPISQKDYYALQAVFAGVEHGERELKTPESERRAREAAEAREQVAGLERRLWRFEALSSAGGGEAAGLGRRAPVHPRRNVDRFPPQPVRFLRFTVVATNQLEPCIDELEVYTAGENPRNVALASAGAKARASSVFPNSEIHRLEHVNDGRYGNGRSWISAEPGKGWVEIELPEALVIDRVIWGRDREGKYADRLPTDYRVEVAASPGAWKLAATSADRRAFVPGARPETAYLASSRAEEEDLARLVAEKKKLEAQLDDLSARKMVYAGNFKAPGPTHLLSRGDPMQEREAVGPGSIAALGRSLSLSETSPEGERRVELAKWIADSKNPLTARVIANRLWHYHFGRGLVTTPSDLGANGARPSHPELLDWLASELTSCGWSLKSLHREILLSSAYRQSSTSRPKETAKDASTRCVWRFPPRRLEAEAIHDAILRVSGHLDLRMGGPGYSVFEPNDNYVRVYRPKEKLGPAEWRRMVYQTKPRKEQDSTFGAFDCPDACQAAPRRTISTNALQALNLLNSSFLLEEARCFARLLEGDGPATDVSEMVKRAFLAAFSREPDEEEAAASVKLVLEHGLPVFCRALFNANEFLYMN
jgi:hypothetical protein